uniref:Uncharacterized protein n=1 Tax=Pinctada fucata TaxID=50426 RepID=A0A194ALA8_PINFU
MLAFNLLVCSLIFLSRADDSLNEENVPTIFSKKYCVRRLDRCDLTDPREIFRSDAEGFALNFTTAGNDNLCRLANEVMLCMTSVAHIPGCREYAERFVLPFEVVQSLEQSLCHGQGRQDLDALASCMNNKQIQLHYYGEVKELYGFISGLDHCHRSMSRREGGPLFDREGGELLEQEIKDAICRAFTKMLRELPRLTMQLCGQTTMSAVLRVMRSVSIVQGHSSELFPLSDQCRFMDNNQ